MSAHSADASGDASPAARRNGRVAVVIPVYRAAFLAEALESVYLQSRPPDEVVVVDDGSPDRDLLHQAVAPYPGLRVVTQANQGAGAARNRGIAATTAEFVALLDADDRWLPDFLRKQMLAFEREPALDLVYTDGVFVGQSALAGRRFMSVCPSRGRVTLDSLLAQECTVLLSSTVLRRAAIEEAGWFDATIRRGQDFELWLRMASYRAQIDYLPEVLVLRRIHDSNLSGTGAMEVERPLRVLEKVLAELPLTARQRSITEQRIHILQADLAREQAKDLLCRGEFDAARRALDGARGGHITWKLQAARVGIRLAPHLLRRLYLARLASAPSWAR